MRYLLSVPIGLKDIPHSIPIVILALIGIGKFHPINVSSADLPRVRSDRLSERVSRLSPIRSDHHAAFLRIDYAALFHAPGILDHPEKSFLLS